MGERVRMVGGSLEIAPSDRGGLSVRAVLPVAS
jgi:signal transduction histidine kinase